MFKTTGTRILIFAIVIALATGAYFMVNVPLPPWSHWLSGLNVVLFAIPAFWVTRWWLGWRDAFLLWLMLGVYALLIETSALMTGFPYGHFGYSDLLGGKLFGTTPWTVFLAWTPLMLGAYGIAANLTGNVPLRIALAAITATAFDLVLDPGAVRLGFWQYADGGSWYGVPWSNFGGWLITTVIAGCLIEGFRAYAKPLLPVPIKLFASALMILLFWTFIAGFGGSTWAGWLGAMMLILTNAAWRRYEYRFDEMLVLCDDNGTAIGTMPKSEVHTDKTPLHLAFSIFLFNSKGELLLQCRSLAKKTWPGVWSNSCCGHQILNVTTGFAARRRLAFELGIKGVKLHCVLPEYRYRAERDGVVENEICPVFVGFTDTEPGPNLDEVETYHWQPWQEFLERIRRADSDISPWAIEEAEMLEANALFNELKQNYEMTRNSTNLPV